MQTTADARPRRASAAARFGPSVWPRPTQTRGGRLLNIAIVTIAVVGALAGLFITWFHLVHDPLSDLRVYFDASVRLNEGQPLYPTSADPNTAYRYPPLLAVLMRPIASLGYIWFAAFWEMVVVGSFVLLVRRLGARSRWTWLAIGAMGMPIGWCLAIGQAQIPMTLLLSIGQPWSIGLAANLKLFPALVALWWLGRRDWRALALFSAWILALGLAQIALEPGGSVSFPATLTVAGVDELVNLSPFAVSPWLWLALASLGGLVTVSLARTRWGWPAAVVYATLASPRVLTYTLMGLLAAIRGPDTKAPREQS